MSPHAPILQLIDKREAAERRPCSAPFEKGGYGGFAFASALGPEQEQIPLNPPFAKGEAAAWLRINNARGCCFAPFEKGGYGGFAFAPDQRHLNKQRPDQEQIPLNPPFAKGEAGGRAADVGQVLP